MAAVLDIKKYLQGLAQIVESGDFADALVSAINTGNGLMQQRIFTRGEDAEGNSLGGYVGKKIPLGIASRERIIAGANTRVKKNRAAKSIQTLTPYQRKRTLSGRQIGYKDLEFNGELRRSIQVFVQNEASVVLAFNNDHSADVAHGQEQQIANIRQGRPGTTRNSNPVPIFSFSDDERDQVIDQGVTLIVDQILK
jgi:hypothetical protein